MSSGKFTYVTADEVISNAQIDLGLTSDKDRNIMREWVWRITKRIGLPHALAKKTEKVEIKDLAFDRPCDLQSVVSVQLCGNQEGGGVYFPEYDTTQFDNDRPEDKGNRRFVTIEEQKDQFVLSSKGSRFTEAIIQYYALPVGPDGDIIIPEFYEDAVTAYLEFMWIKRERRRGSKQDGNNPIPQSEVEAYRDQFRRLRAELETQKNMPNEMQAEEIIREWQTLLPNQRKLRKNTIRRFFFGGISV